MASLWARTRAMSNGAAVRAAVRRAEMPGFAGAYARTADLKPDAMLP